MINKQLEEFKAFLESDAGRESTREFAMKIQNDRQHTLRWVEKIRHRYGNNIDDLIELLVKKYSSDAYIDREYKLGREPKEELLWMVYEYAKLYCDPCNDEKFINAFTHGAYYIGRFVIQLMIGQGSTLRIDENN